jgi:hypothetical protein
VDTPEKRFSTALEHDAQFDAGLLACHDHGVGVVQAQGHGFFYQNVFFCLGGGNRLGGVLSAGSADAYNVDGRIGQKLFKGLAGRAELGADVAKSIRVVVTDGHQVCTPIRVSQDGLPVILGNHSRAQNPKSVGSVS